MVLADFVFHLHTLIICKFARVTLCIKRLISEVYSYLCTVQNFIIIFTYIQRLFQTRSMSIYKYSCIKKVFDIHIMMDMYIYL